VRPNLRHDFLSWCILLRHLPCNSSQWAHWTHTG
jgi:hypothetical protein